MGQDAERITSMRRSSSSGMKRKADIQRSYSRESVIELTVVLSETLTEKKSNRERQLPHIIENS